MNVRRRTVLKAGAVVGATGLALGLRGDAEDWLPDPVALPTLTATLTRRVDQLALRFEFFNLKLLKAGQSGPGDISTVRLVREVANQPAYVVVQFGPQSLGEQAIFDDGDPGLLLKPKVMAVVAGGTRLAFAVPGNVAAIPYTISGLLNWQALTQSVVPTAVKLVQGQPIPVAPSETQTAIEAPWRLALSPHDQAAWAHTVTPDATTHGGRTELWHTRLAVRKGTRIDEQDPTDRTVRAVWTNGFVRNSPPLAPGPTPPGRTSLTPLDRYEIVRLSSDWKITSHLQPYVPQPLAVRQLALSSGGAWVKTDGDWPDVYDDALNRPFVVQSWTQRTAGGRDQFVRVVKGGFLFPFGHRASLIIITERAFREVTDVTDPQLGKPGAFLLQRAFLDVREPERSYPVGAGPQPFGGRAMPFRKVRLTTRTTPDLVAFDGAEAVPETKVLSNLNDPNGPFYGEAAFWPRVSTGANSSQDFLFPVVVTDADGYESEMLIPLIYVRGDMSNVQSHAEKFIQNYEAAAPTRRTRPMHGQQVALAAFPNGTKGECAYPLADITFGASLPQPPNAQLDAFRQPRFYPVMRTVKARLDAVERVAGSSYGATELTLHDAWLNGLPNAGRLFAKLTAPVDLTFGADTSGGVITPNLNITGLSASTGPIGGDLSQPAPTQFTPEDFFAGAAPRLLGGISLLDIIDVAPFGPSGGAPRLVSTPVPEGIETALTWRPVVRNDDAGVFERSTPDSMVIVARTVQRHDGAPPVTEIAGDLTNFKVHAVGKDLQLATVDFKRLKFHSANGAKPNVDVDIRAVQFHGVLEFVNKLQQFLSSAGSSGAALAKAAPGGSDGGAYVEVTTSGIRVGYLLALPPIAMGVFSLENISLGSALNIPFDGQPARVRFNFAERERPFVLTVSLFGGGGFVGVSFGLDQFELFEAALEFGAKLALDIGVASGGISAMAGVYLAIGATEGELTGYLRLNGNLEIIGLITMSIEFYLGFTYDMDTKEVWGEASVTVSVDVLLFSGSVTLGPIRKRFAGGGGASSAAPAAFKAAAALGVADSSPTFSDFLSQADWADYCALYAPAAF